MRETPIIKPMSQVTETVVEGCTGASIQVLLGPDDGMPNFYTRRVTIQPGGRIPAHRHQDIEHQQVVLQGELELVLDGEPRTVSCGDCVYIPARVGHAYENHGDVPVRFLCMVPATETYETELLEAD